MQATGGGPLPCPAFSHQLFYVKSLQPPTRLVCWQMLRSLRKTSQDMPSVANPSSAMLSSAKQQTCYLLMCMAQSTHTDSDKMHLMAWRVSNVTPEGLASGLNTCTVC
jgi:hypothetical protein